MSRSGPSLSLGPRGAHITVGHGHIRETVGIPGSGISWTKTVGGSRQTRTVARRPVRARAPTYARGAAGVAATTTGSSSLKGCLWVIGIIVLVAATIATYGIALVVVLVVWWFWAQRRRKQPDQVAKRLIKQADSLPQEQAVHLLHEALDTDPDGVATTWSCANWFFAHQCWPDAADAYASYLHHPHQVSVELSYAQALLRGGHLDEAVAELQTLRSNPSVAEDTQFSALAELAEAFYLKGDFGQGLAVANTAPLQRRNMSGPLQGCLLTRALGRYLAGQRSQGIADLERLYAMSSRPEVLEMKQKMSSGTFTMDAVKPYPDWYPEHVQLREGPPVEESSDQSSDVLESGQISPDGRWQWDGQAWLPISIVAPSDTVGGTLAEAPAAASTARMGEPSITVADVPQAPPAVFPSVASVPNATQTTPATATEANAFGPVIEPSPALKSVPTVLAATASPSGTAPQFSPDQSWWWNGREWVSAISDDGRHRWDGDRWIAADGAK